MIAKIIKYEFEHGYYFSYKELDHFIEDLDNYLTTLKVPVETDIKGAMIIRKNDICGTIAYLKKNDIDSELLQNYFEVGTNSAPLYFYIIARIKEEGIRQIVRIDDNFIKYMTPTNLKKFTSIINLISVHDMHITIKDYNQNRIKEIISNKNVGLQLDIESGTVSIVSSKVDQNILKTLIQCNNVSPRYYQYITDPEVFELFLNTIEEYYYPGIYGRFTDIQIAVAIRRKIPIIVRNVDIDYMTSQFAKLIAENAADIELDAHQTLRSMGMAIQISTNNNNVNEQCSICYEYENVVKVKHRGHYFHVCTECKSNVHFHEKCIYCKEPIDKEYEYVECELPIVTTPDIDNPEYNNAQEVQQEQEEEQEEDSFPEFD